MKRILLLTTFLTFFLFTQAGHSATSMVLVAKDTIVYGEVGATFIEAYATLKNLTKKNLYLRVRMYVLKLNSIDSNNTQQLGFCAGDPSIDGYCYAFQTKDFFATDSFLLKSQVTMPAGSFIGRLLTNDIPGNAKARYCFYNTADSNDHTCFDVNFIVPISSVEIDNSMWGTSDVKINSILNNTLEVLVNEKYVNSEFTIQDITGRIIKHINLINQLNYYDLNDISSGIYFVTITKNGIVAKSTKIIIKN